MIGLIDIDDFTEYNYKNSFDTDNKLLRYTLLLTKYITLNIIFKNYFIIVFLHYFAFRPTNTFNDCFHDKPTERQANENEIKKLTVILIIPISITPTKTVIINAVA